MQQARRGRSALEGTLGPVEGALNQYILMIRLRALRCVMPRVHAQTVQLEGVGGCWGEHREVDRRSARLIKLGAWACM